MNACAPSLEAQNVYKIFIYLFILYPASQLSLCISHIKLFFLSYLKYSPQSA